AQYWQKDVSDKCPRPMVFEAGELLGMLLKAVASLERKKSAKAVRASAEKTKGKQSFYGPAEGQAVHVILEAVAQALGFANNEVMNPAFVNNKVLSATSDSSIYVTGIVNQSVTCILRHTCATASVLNEGTWRKIGFVSKQKPVFGTLTTANRNELTKGDERKY
ncbi:unnamed protein product, partial [Porites lobata]